MIKSCNVDRVFKLEQRWPDASSASTKVYFVSPTLANAKIILDHLNMSNSIQKGLIFHVIFMPKLLKEVDIFLEEEGAHGKLTIHGKSIRFRKNGIPVHSEFSANKSQKILLHE